MVVYLRARTGPWKWLAQAMHQRGWMTVSNAQQAWYVSRAGARCVHVDAYGGRGNEMLTVALCVAVEAQPAEDESYPIADLLPVTAGIALERAYPGATKYHVPVQTMARDWKRLA
ncbi:hypothetical protein [Streptomyces sp. NPDC048845]|uniref:hypothetical protein n=1 Tax=Streptomyces sp. NPDC048845 TaxID=3155390 RepID=UPI00341EC56D